MGPFEIRRALRAFIDERFLYNEIIAEFFSFCGTVFYLTSHSTREQEWRKEIERNKWMKWRAKKEYIEDKNDETKKRKESRSTMVNFSYFRNSTNFWYQGKICINVTHLFLICTCPYCIFRTIRAWVTRYNICSRQRGVTSIVDYYPFFLKGWLQSFIAYRTIIINSDIKWCYSSCKTKSKGINEINYHLLFFFRTIYDWM